MGEVPVYRRAIRVGEIAPGVWYPVGCEEVRYTEPNRPGQTPVVKSRDIRIGEPIPDGQYDIESLGLDKDDPNLMVLRTTPDGQMIRYVYREGKLVLR